jgi:hypothetical protein
MPRQDGALLADFGPFPMICTFSYTVGELPILLLRPLKLVLSPKELRIVLGIE